MTAPDIQTLVQTANAARQKGDFAGARKALGAALAQSPDNPGLLNSLGVLEHDAGQFADAVDWYRRAIAADANAPVLWLNLAKTLRSAEDEAGELQALDAALALDQGLLMAQVRKAEWLDRNGREAEAFAQWSGLSQWLSTADLSQPALADLKSLAETRAKAYSARFAAAVEPVVDAALSGLDYEERRRFDAFFGATLGRRRIYENECAGLKFPMLPADEYFPRSHFPWMDRLETHFEAIRDEVLGLLDAGGAGFAPYVSMPPGTPENKWSELSDSNRWDACYIWKYGQAVEAMHARCPRTVAALSEIERFDIEGRGPTAFFSLLRPHTRIPPHTGVSNMRAIIHLPLVVPDGCSFRVGGETRLWEPGKAFAFDDSIDHEARNDSAEVRAILIFDVWNPHITPAERDLIRNYYRAADASGLAPMEDFSA